MSEEAALDAQNGPFDHFSKGADELDTLKGAVDQESSVEETVPITEVKKLRSEAAKWRIELRNLQAQVEADKKRVELEKLSVQERLQSELEEARQKADSYEKASRSLAKDNIVINIATELGAIKPMDVAKLIDEVPYDENGHVDYEGTRLQITEFLKERPYMSRDKKQDANFGATNPPPTGDNSLPRPKLTNADKVNEMKQQARDLTRQGRVAEATRLFNRAWEIEHPKDKL